MQFRSWCLGLSLDLGLDLSTFAIVPEAIPYWLWGGRASEHITWLNRPNGIATGLAALTLLKYPPPSPRPFNKTFTRTRELFHRLPSIIKEQFKQVSCSSRFFWVASVFQQMTIYERVNRDLRNLALRKSGTGVFVAFNVRYIDDFEIWKL